MTGVQMMVVLIVAMVTIASIIKARYRPHGAPGGGHDAASAGESARLREELQQLKERLAVLERITVEKESTLERQIEELRDR